jgi:hypothetical protein
VRTTPNNIDKLGPNEIFVFGSNTQGRHGRGAAKTAHEKFGACQGIGEGLCESTYAFPTLDADPYPGPANLRERSHEELLLSAAAFKTCAAAYPELTFYLTKVGCGLAGYNEEYMKSLFTDCPPNVIKPEGW